MPVSSRIRCWPIFDTSVGLLLTPDDCEWRLNRSRNASWPEHKTKQFASILIERERNLKKLRTGFLVHDDGDEEEEVSLVVVEVKHDDDDDDDNYYGGDYDDDDDDFSTKDSFKWLSPPGDEGGGFPLPSSRKIRVNNLTKVATQWTCHRSEANPWPSDYMTRILPQLHLCMIVAANYN